MYNQRCHPRPVSAMNLLKIKQNKKKTLSTKYLGTKEHVLCVVDCTKLHILFLIFNY